MYGLMAGVWVGVGMICFEAYDKWTITFYYLQLFSFHVSYECIYEPTIADEECP